MVKVELKLLLQDLNFLTALMSKHMALSNHKVKFETNKVNKLTCLVKLSTVLRRGKLQATCKCICDHEKFCAFCKSEILNKTATKLPFFSKENKKFSLSA